MRESPRFAPETWVELFDQSNDILLVIDVAAARVSDANATAHRVLGYESGDLVGATVDEIAGFADERSWREHLSEITSDQHVGTNELYTADGGTIPIEASVTRARADGDEYALVVARDISDRKARAAELKREKDRAEQYFETAGNIMVVLDRDGFVERINERGCDLLGYERSELEGEDWFELVVPEEIEADIDEIFEGYATGRIEGINTHTNPIVVRDGIRKHIQWHNTALRDESGDVDAILASGIDITDRLEYERDLERYEQFVENASDITVLLDASGQGVYVSPSAERVLGYDPADLVGRNAFEDVHPDDRDELRGAFESVLEDPGTVATVEYRIRHADGSWVWVESRGRNLLDNPDIEGVLLSTREITERKRYERELERFERFVENANDVIVSITPGGEIEYASPAVESVLGYEPDEMVGTPAFEYIHPEDVDQIEERMDQMIEDGESMPTTAELRVQQADGTWIWVESTCTTCEERAEGNTGLAVLRDVTARKNYENQLEAQRDDLEVLNQVMRHDIRNDLQLVTAYAEILRDRLDGEEREYVETIESSSKSAVRMTKVARDLSKAMLETGGDLEPVSLSTTVEDQVEKARSTYGSAVISVDGSIPEVTVPANELFDSVVWNILQNAVQHNDKAVPEVHVRADRSDGRVTLSIADNGPGIPDDQKSRVFERGGSGNGGAGLGLYLVKYIVDSYDGSVQVEDNEPTGAVFHVQLPTTEASDENHGAEGS